MYLAVINYIFLIPLLYFIYLYENRCLLGLFLVVPLLISKVSLDLVEIEESSNQIYEVYEVKNNQCYLNANRINYIIFSCEGYKPGDLVLVTGELSTPSDSRTDSSFSYKDYLLSKNVKIIIYQKEIRLVGSRMNINLLGYNLKEEIDIIFQEKTADYLKTLVYGESLESDASIDISNIGINHLFAISGLHITLVLSVLSKILSYITKKSGMILNTFCMLYIVVTNYSFSVMRASLMYILGNNFKGKLNSFDVCLIVMYIQLLFKPYAFYNIGFIYSYFVSIIIILSKEILVSSSKRKQMICIAIYVFIFSAPLNMYFNYEISFMTILYNIIFSLILVFVIMPIVFVTYIFPIFENIFLHVIEIFEITINIFSKTNIKIITGNISLIHLMYSYFIIINIIIAIELRKLKIKKIITFMFLSIFFLVEVKVYDIEVSFLNIQQGESIILSTDDCVTIFDVGEGYSSNNVSNYIIPHLKSRGINKVDNVFITHDDYDHYGGINDLDENFNISNIYVNEYSSLNYKTIKSGNVVSCGNIDFQILAPLEDINDNNNSLVIYFKFNDVSFLFTGDIEEEVEELLIARYPELDIDILKVAHHGSDSSTTSKFLSHVNPRVAIIPVDINNSHNHPSISVVEKIEKRGIDLYRTDTQGTIYFYLKGNDYYVKT